MSTSPAITLIILMCLLICNADLAIRSKKSHEVGSSMLYGLVCLTVLIASVVTLVY